MTEIFNKKELKERRRTLRHNMTKAEAILWSHIKNRQISGQRFLRQFSIEGYVVDFYCQKLRLVIEVDGATHITDDEIEYDLRRQTEIENLDIKFLRFTNPEIYDNLYSVLETIKSKIAELKITAKPQ